MDNTTRQAPPQLTACPQCSAPAEIVRRAVLESTDGPVEHAAVRCVANHVFFLPLAWLDRPARSGRSAPPTRARAGQAQSARVERR